MGLTARSFFPGRQPPGRLTLAPGTGGCDVPRFPHALTFREWALDYPPSQLRRIAVRRWELFVSCFGKPLSPGLLEVWRALVLGEERAPDQQASDRETKSTIWNERFLEEYVRLISFMERLPGVVGLPVIGHLPPFQVPVDHVHLFDLRASLIRRCFSQGARDPELANLGAAIKEFFKASAEADEFAKWTQARPVMDRVFPAWLRDSDGFAIHHEMLRHWIAFNVRSARRAVDPRDREAAHQSLERICAALFPSEWSGEGPNEAGLAFDYRFIREQADPVLKRKFRNSELKRTELHRRLPQFERSLIDRWADCSPREFALALLSARYALKPGYVWNLVKRGNLHLAITLHWRKALLSSPPRQPSAATQS